MMRKRGSLTVASNGRASIIAGNASFYASFLLVAKTRRQKPHDSLHAQRAFRALEAKYLYKPKQKRHASARRKRDGRWLPRTAS